MNLFSYLLRNYANFKGRARRREFWLFFLFSTLIIILTGWLDILLGFAKPEMSSVTGKLDMGPLRGVAMLVILIPKLAVLVRRLHDTGKSGWLTVMLFIPLLGQLYLISVLIRNSTKGPNEYGPNPKIVAERSYVEA